MTRILVIDDDPATGQLLGAAFERHGYASVHASDGRTGLVAVATEPFDVVLLDVGLPDIEGLQVCRRLRHEQPWCVLVMLTERAEEMDGVLALEAGADDYLTKPIRLEELLARVRAHLRRSASWNGHAPDPVYAAGLLRIDVSARRCRLGGTEVTLRAKEFDLIARLGRDAGAAVSRETLIADVWDVNWFGSTKTLDVHVAALRHRLAEAAARARVAAPSITTLRGFGYRLESA